VTSPNLSQDISLLTDALHSVFAKHRGEDAADLLRNLVRQCQELDAGADDPFAEPLQRIAGTSDDDLHELLKILTIHFHLVNKAEQVEIARINRERERRATTDAPRAESIAEAISHLKQQGLSLEAVLRVLERLDIQPTFTAHPTEARRQSILRQQRGIADALEENQNPALSPKERTAIARRIRRAVHLMYATDEIRLERPQVIEEVRHGLYFLSGPVWDVIPQLYRDIRDALFEHYQALPTLPTVLRYRSWIGGDRDGNPRVTANVTRDTLTELRQTVLEKYRNEMATLQREISVSRARLSIPPELNAAIELDQQEYPLDDRERRMLMDIVEQLEKGKPSRTIKGGTVDLGALSLPSIPRHSGDRNRTSPFAFTGNKFELRAVGSSATAAWPNTILNTIVAESLDFLATTLEKEAGKNPTPAKLEAAVRKVLKDVIKEHKRVIFNGDNYSEDWHKEAEKRGLPHLRDSVRAIPVLAQSKNISLFKKYKVMNNAEVKSRANIFMSRYVDQLLIESEQMVVMGRTMILPAALQHQQRLATAVKATMDAGVDCKDSKSSLETFVDLVQRFNVALTSLQEADNYRHDDPVKTATWLKDDVVPLMDRVRELGDELEAEVAADLWPLPSYRDLLFIK